MNLVAKSLLLSDLPNHCPVNSPPVAQVLEGLKSRPVSRCSLSARNCPALETAQSRTALCLGAGWQFWISSPPAHNWLRTRAAR